MRALQLIYEREIKKRLIYLFTPLLRINEFMRREEGNGIDKNARFYTC